MKDAYDLIHKAIQEKLQMVIRYKDKVRSVCPHVLGWKRGRGKALFYQFEGGSNSGLSEDYTKRWRGAFVDEVEVLELRSGNWHTGPNHSRPQNNVDEIDIEVMP